MVDFPIRVIVTPEGAESGARRVGKSLDNVERKAANLQATLFKAFAIIGGASAVRSSVQAISNFEQTLSTVRAVAGATADEFTRLRETAIKLGSSTRFSATQAGEGLVLLAQAGFTVVESIEAVDDVLRLAQAGGLGLARSADIASSVLRGFRLNVDQAGRVMDVLAQAANASNTSVEDLGTALSFVAPVAAGLGIDIESTTAAIEALSNAGLGGSLAGTGLRRVLSELESPSQKTKEILGSLGVTADEVRVSQVGLSGALERLAKTSIDTGQALEIFGDRGGPAFEVLRSSAGDLARFEEGLRNSAGVAQRVADVMDDNLNGALLRAGNAFSALIIRVSESSGATSGLTVFVSNLANGLAGLVADVDPVIDVIQTLAFALGVTFGVKAIGAAIGGIKALTIALAANPLFALVAVLTTVGSLLIGFGDKIIALTDGITTFQDVAVSAFRELFFVLGSVFGLIDSEGSSATAALREVFSPDVIEDFAKSGAVFLDALIGGVKGFASAAGVYFDNFGTNLKAAFVVASNFVIDVINGLVRLFFQQINNIRANLEELSRSLPGFVVNFDQIIAPQIPRFDDSVVKEAAQNGKRINEAFAEGVESSTAFQDSLDRIIVGATEISVARSREKALALLQELQLESGTPVPGVTPVVPEAGGAGGLGGAEEGANNAAVAVENFTTKLMEANVAAQNLSATFGEVLVQGIERSANALSTFLINGAKDFDSLRTAVADILQDMAQQILAAIIKALILRAIVGEAGGGGAGGAAAGGLIGLFSRRAGGSVAPGTGYLTGEAGMELFVPSSSPYSSAVGAMTSARRYSYSSYGGVLGRASGGAVQPLGVNGPQLFNPPSAGTIIPAAQTAALMQAAGGGGSRGQVVVPAPQVTVNQPPINVMLDGNEIRRRTLETDEGRAFILRTGRNNPEALR